MPHRIQRIASAAFAVAVLAGLMIHASVTSGCSASTPVAGPESPNDAAPAAAAEPAAPPEEEETFFPASKAGPMKPRKAHAPPSQNQNAAPNQK